MSHWTTLLQRLAGNWQLPLAALSAIALPASALLLKRDANDVTLEEAAKAMEGFVASGLYGRAERLGAFMLSRSDCVGVECAVIELNLARALYGKAVSGSPGEPEAQAIVQHFKGAAMRNATLTPIDIERLGGALEWRGQYLAALQWYEQAIADGHPDPLRIKRRVITVLRDELEVPTKQLVEAVDEFLSTVGDERLDLRLWAIEEKLQLLDDQGRPELGAKLLADHSAAFEGSDLLARFEYLRCLVLHKLNRFDEAEVCLRAVRNAVEPRDEVNAMAGWLLGRTVMFDGGPQRPMEALSFFRDVARLHAGSPYALASKIGSAEALAFLERDEEAIAAYRTAISEMGDLRSRLVNLDRVRASLGVTAEQRRVDGGLEAALEYARLAASLVDETEAEQAIAVLQQLASLQAALAERWEATEAKRPLDGSDDVDDVEPTPGDFRKLYGEAADTYARLADLDVYDERRTSEAAWLAAELSGRGGRRGEAIDRYRQFIAQRPQSELVPRALLRIGQLLQAAGRLNDAVEAYQQCYRRFPKTLDGIRTLIPLAQSYIGLGSDHLELAERTLQLVLTSSEVFTPEAPEFADALFLLGDIYNRQGRFEESIATLEEASSRYPDDPRVWRSRFLVANAYRRSALAIRDDASDADSGAVIERARSESRDRLSEARRLYRELIEEYESRGTGRLNELQALYLRHSRLYEADCYFELQDYRTALKLYDAAAGMFKDSPRALSAYVQVINCHVFLGQPGEARAALARARVLASRLGPQTYANHLSPEKKEEWLRYLDWLSKSELF